MRIGPSEPIRSREKFSDDSGGDDADFDSDFDT